MGLGATSDKALDRSDILQKGKMEDRAKTEAIERAKREHAEREQLIRDRQREQPKPEE